MSPNMPRLTDHPGLAKGTARVLSRPGHLLREALAAAGLSQRWLAQRLGLGLTEICRQVDGVRRVDLERLHRTAPSIALAFHRLCIAALEDSATVHAAPGAHQRRLCALVGELAGALDTAEADGALDASERTTLEAV